MFKFRAEAGKNVKEQEKLTKGFKCDIYNYRSEKETTLKKHVLSKHTGQKCTICSKEFKTSLEVLSHIANEHHELEEPYSIQLQSIPKSSKERKSKFVLSESILDEYL